MKYYPKMRVKYLHKEAYYTSVPSDLYSRYVVGWSLDNTMTKEWCKKVIEDAVNEHGAPEILNTDQGSQFTSDHFTSYVRDVAKIRLSRDGKVRAIDNVFI